VKRILFGSANHWTSPYQVGSHAWARLFADQGWDVAYLSDPITPAHWMKGRTATMIERFDLWKSGGRWFDCDRVRAWVPQALVCPQNLPVLRSSGVLENWNALAFPNIRAKLEEWGFVAPDVLWLDSVRHAHLIEQINPGMVILRVADWSPGFAEVPPSALKKERELLGSVDLVITSAETLTERLVPFRKGKPILTVRNGGNSRFWQVKSPAPPEYDNIKGPRVVYVGAIDSWFDAGLVQDLARQMPQVAFVMIGTPKCEVPAAPNLHWLGSRKRAEVRSFLQHSQAAIIPFRRNDLIDCTCPLKLFEYSACGLPIVASRWSEMERMHSPAQLAESCSDWREKLEQALSRSSDALMQASLKEYAASNDWSVRWRKLEAELARFA
jgi:glycosyltransferase involved in cell wall biosynthesis